MPADHFAITVPRSWFELPVEPDRRDDRISALVQERIVEHRDLWDHRTEIVRVLRRFARSAWDSGARYCAAFAEPSEDGIVSGALTVSVLPAPAGSEDPLGSLTDHVAALGGADDGMHVDVHDVPRVGRVPRVWGVSTVQAPDDRGSFDVVLMQTFVPADGQVALVSVSSPATDLAEPLLELFETVTDTFELLDSATVGDPGPGDGAV
ncbi:hypothetical protein QP735_00375 [Curtobacterium citreum]|uniref:hypothetical protein n=1 Tax=Curtobacterium citreum TaxID=2036 RepID=UPI00195616F1|nr:hypothetical protein [Curtobacterium citreum]MDK8170972.1 hypothetical protein [Curtobacterium citreum]